VQGISQRNTRELRREDLFDDYLSIAKKRKDGLVATALRTQSTSMRDILVHAILGQPLKYDLFMERVFSGQIEETQIRDVGALGDLGRLVVLQNLRDDDLAYAERLLSLAHDFARDEQLSKDSRRVWIQHQVLSGNKKIAEELLDNSPDIDEELYGYLRAELLNPYLAPHVGNYDEWLQNFNQFFTDKGLAPVGFHGSGAAPFDRAVTSLVAQSDGDKGDDPLVSVVLTTYQPNENHLLSSVHSILEQTWKNLELIVVDDCSGTDYSTIFRRIQELDPRIKIIHAPENRGTYVARNIGYAASAGDLITGQDDDDWSHPQRLVHQVEFLRENPENVACRVMAIRCDDNLGRCRRGYKPIVFNPSSLMVRREGYERVGNYLDSRKGADSEYYFRLKSVTGGKVANIKKPLSIIRILPESLSRGDFAAGWKHPSRTAFRSAYRYWHRNATLEELNVTSKSVPPVKIPSRFRVDSGAGKRPEFDVVYAGDWQRYGGPQKSMLEEIFALVGANYRVGIMNLEAARFMSEEASEPLNDVIQQLINTGTVGEVFYDDNIHLRLLILRYPPILQFFTHERSKLSIDEMVIVANQAPSELDGSDIRYLVDDCHKNAITAFGVTPRWVPQGPQVRDFLTHYLASPQLASFDMPGILNLDDWWLDRLWYRSTIPVVGRHSRDDTMKWPNKKEDIKEIYRTDGQYDVRIMGGHRTPLRVLGSRQVPAGWTVYKKNAMPVSDFLYSLDYFVFYQHPRAIEAFGRAVLEALAAGALVILPKHFERVFGGAAIYADIEEVDSIITELHSDFSVYRAQLEHSKAILNEKFSYSSYRKLIKSLLSEDNLGK